MEPVYSKSYKLYYDDFFVGSFVSELTKIPYDVYLTKFKTHWYVVRRRPSGQVLRRTPKAIGYQGNFDIRLWNPMIKLIEDFMNPDPSVSPNA